MQKHGCEVCKKINDSPVTTASSHISSAFHGVSNRCPPSRLLVAPICPHLIEIFGKLKDNLKNCKYTSAVSHHFIFPHKMSTNASFSKRSASFSLSNVIYSTSQTGYIISDKFRLLHYILQLDEIGSKK